MLTDPNMYSKTTEELYVGRGVRVRMDAEFDIPDGPGEGDGMEDMRGMQTTIAGIQLGYKHADNLVWVYLENDDGMGYTWDMRWLDLLS